MNPNNPLAGVSAKSAHMQEAARAKGVQLRILEASSESEIAAAFAMVAELQAGALVVGTDLFFFSQRE